VDPGRRIGNDTLVEKSIRKCSYSAVCPSPDSRLGGFYNSGGLRQFASAIIRGKRTLDAWSDGIASASWYQCAGDGSAIGIRCGASSRCSSVTLRHFVCRACGSQVSCDCLVFRAIVSANKVTLVLN